MPRKHITRTINAHYLEVSVYNRETKTKETKMVSVSKRIYDRCKDNPQELLPVARSKYETATAKVLSRCSWKISQGFYRMTVEDFMSKAKLMPEKFNRYGQQIVSRNVRGNSVEFLFLDETGEEKTMTIEVDGGVNIDELVQEYCDKRSIDFLEVLEVTEKSGIYYMQESDFIKNAELVETPTSEDLEEDREQQIEENGIEPIKYE